MYKNTHQWDEKLRMHATALRINAMGKGKRPKVRASSVKPSIPYKKAQRQIYSGVGMDCVGPAGYDPSDSGVKQRAPVPTFGKGRRPLIGALMDRDAKPGPG